MHVWSTWQGVDKQKLYSPFPSPPWCAACHRPRLCRALKQRRAGLQRRKNQVYIFWWRSDHQSIQKAVAIGILGVKITHVQLMFLSKWPSWMFQKNIISQKKTGRFLFESQKTHPWKRPLRRPSPPWDAWARISCQRSGTQWDLVHQVTDFFSVWKKSVLQEGEKAQEIHHFFMMFHMDLWWSRLPYFERYHQEAYRTSGFMLFLQKQTPPSESSKWT